MEFSAGNSNGSRKESGERFGRKKCGGGVKFVVYPSEVRPLSGGPPKANHVTGHPSASHPLTGKPRERGGSGSPVLFSGGGEDSRRIPVPWLSKRRPSDWTDGGRCVILKN